MGSSGHGQGRRWYNDWAGAVLISSGLIERGSLEGKSYLFCICILGGRIMRNLGAEWRMGMDPGITGGTNPLLKQMGVFAFSLPLI